MPLSPCPTCSTLLRLLPMTSAEAHVHYYRCDACAALFTQPKTSSADALTEITHVTVEATAGPR